MTAQNTAKTQAGTLLTWSCYHTESRSGEQFVKDHALTCQLSGSLTLTDGNKSIVSGPGAVVLARRNNLLKFIKTPPAGGDFESLSLYFTQEVLKSFTVEYNMKAEHRPIKTSPVVQFKPNDLLQAFVASLLAYQKSNVAISQQMVELKMREGLMIILGLKPELKAVLFDFTDPHKIDLEAFMNQNFHFNVHLDRFAYLTGRSLATYKRDFSKIFRTTPGKWLLHKRLQAAHFLIKEKHRHPSDIYLDLGFEDLSHFSYVFKKEFGLAPTKFVDVR